MSGYQRPVDAATLAANFRVFADAECALEPLYATFSRGIANDPTILAQLLAAPYPQRRPVLLFACVHDLLLAGVEHALADFYPTVAKGERLRRDVDAAMPAFADFCRVQRDALHAALTTRATQTNEVGRSAGLRFALAHLDTTRPVALIDVGCSAGLNLLVDRFRVDYRGDEAVRITGPESSPVTIEAKLVGSMPDTMSTPSIGARFGVDVAPLDVRDMRDARWLHACVWPGDLDRHARLDGAIALAMEVTLDLRRGDATACIADILADVPPPTRPVVFHSWVVSYFERDTKSAFAEAMRAMVRERDGVWISAEAPGVSPSLPVPPLEADATAERREATVWHVTSRDGSGACSSLAIARSHPHCRWIESLA